MVAVATKCNDSNADRADVLVGKQPVFSRAANDMERLVGGAAGGSKSGLENQKSQGKSSKMVPVVERGNRCLARLAGREKAAVVVVLSVSDMGGRLGAAITNGALPNGGRKCTSGGR